MKLHQINKKIMSYLWDTYSHYILRGESYSQDCKIIQINFSYGLHHSDLFRIYKIEDDNKNQFANDFLIYEINIDKLEKLWFSKVVKKYMEELKRVNEDPEFREFMSAEEDNRKIENSIKEEYTRKGINIGKKEGIDIGTKKNHLML